MARKFKVGDTVEVVKELGSYSQSSFFRIGHRGKVTDYESNEEYPYTVKRRNGMINQFKAQELKLIKRKGN